MHEFTVTDVSQAAPDVALLTLTPKTDDDRLDFYPGQYATIGFKTAGRPTPMRCFSIVSSPHDTRTLQFAMRVQGNFTSTVSHLQPGDDAFVRGPFGSFVIDPDYDKNVVLIAGGIGITPFISMLRHATATQLAIPITLLYGVRSQDTIPFYDELLALERQNPQFKVAFFISDGSVTPTQDARMVRGKIDEQRIEQITGGKYQGITYFICGPKGFMRDLQRTLSKKRVSPHRIVTESFAQAHKLSFGGALSIPKITYALTAVGMVLGFGFIMALDLVRYVPNHASADTTPTPTTTSTPSSSSATTTDNTATNNTATNSDSNTGNSSTNSSTDTSQSQSQTTTPTYYYRRPVSSMS